MKFLNCQELADRLGVGRNFITSMKAWGFKGYGGNNFLYEDALSWLRGNPNFNPKSKPVKCSKSSQTPRQSNASLCKRR